MSEKRAFDDAIYILRLEEQEEAAKVLEAAGKVDKQMLNTVLYDFDGFVRSATFVDKKQLADFLSALLEALPDKEEK